MEGASGMTLHELSSALRDLYENAPRGEQATMVHLFGIRYASEIRASGCTPKMILQDAGMGTSWQTEISKGIRLSRYVVEKS